MDTNPYQTPAETQAESHYRSTPPQSGLSQHITAIAVIAAVSFGLAMLVTPADPLSMIVAAVPIFVIVLSAYLFGFRNGKKQSNDDRIDEG